ncbi:MAG: alpha-L-fucosidase [Verrucomicrobia bacterium]|nr:alpha-L-fucosidase [Verrucomicrobiota bacterium]MCH8513111.1 alpha-L-fucosidase [Kiritimatiellia bacterium]
MNPLITHQRQVHLDFHTSPHIPGIAAAFDAEAFADTYARAHVNSVTLFAKCHHGYTYYPSRVCEPHPELVPKERDLLGEQIQSLHRRGIRAPIYITVGWDELASQTHPDWRAMTRDGRFADWPGQPGMWRFMNWLHPEYQQHIEDITLEVMARYGDEVDGFFYDICFFPKNACWSPESLAFRAKHGLMEDSLAGFERFQAKAQACFSKRYADLIRAARPQATVFFNAGSDSFLEPGLGARARYEHMTHMEIESLPSGFWGYFHFPRLARSTGHWGKPWLGMTGRFQTMWGDFGGLKPQAALEFECFRSQAMGGANSIGDQLPPCGVPDNGAYELIGAVYEQVAAAEPFYAGSEPLTSIGITTSGTPGLDGNVSALSDEGAIQMCEEAHYDCRLLDAMDTFEGLELIILGDNSTLTPEVVDRLRIFYAGGGKLMVSYKGGCNAQGEWVLDFLPVRLLGECAFEPAYWRTQEDFSPALSMSDRVVYQRGLRFAACGAEVLAERVHPYFNRDAVRYCSHRQTPPRPEASGEPVLMAGERFVVFADPVFREYREYGNIAVRDAWRLAMHRLVGSAPFGDGLPGTIQIYPRRRGQDLLLTLLHYIPVRKAVQIDMIEERGRFAGEILALPPKIAEVHLFGGPILEQIGEGQWKLPDFSRGRLLLEVPGYLRES